MAVKKMNMINISGPLDMFDEVMDKCIMGKNIHIEDVTDMAGKRRGIYTFSGSNPYEEGFRHISELCEVLSINPHEIDDPEDIQNFKIEEYIEHVKDDFLTLRQKLEALQQDIDSNKILSEQLALVGDIDERLEDIFDLEFMKVRFGRLTKDAYDKFNTYMENVDAIFIKGQDDGRYVYGIYVTPKAVADKADDVFASLNFERIRISEKACEKPSVAMEMLKAENEELNRLKNETTAGFAAFLKQNEHKILSIYSLFKRKFNIYKIRSLAVKTADNFYVSGWAGEADAADISRLIKDIFGDTVTVSIETELSGKNVPTELSNPKIIKPFEFFVKLYSLPKYSEIDPTPILAVTYFILFGMMFGDMGQGLVLSLFGWILYAKKKMDLGAIIGCVGISAAVFGALYGSIFGIELHGDIFPIWISPSEDTVTILIAAIAVGVVHIVAAMAVNLINAVKNRDWGEFFFSKNGVSGIVFYVAVIATVYLSIMKGAAISSLVVVFLFIIPVILMFLKEPLSNILKKRKPLEGTVGAFLTESFFEMFEVILSYVTNTVSFIRIGAFALVHAGMMLVVHSLMEMIGGTGGTVVFVLGNIFVMCLEALLVGIQTLRLEFFELFSRFYTGSGREFVAAYKDKN